MVRAYKDNVLKPGQFAGLRFLEGTIFLVVKAAEEVELTYNFNSDAKITPGADIGFVTPVDSNSRRLLEPNTSDTINHIFVGVTPSQARLYVNHPSGRITRTLLGTRTIGGQFGFVRGADSPYNDPAPDFDVWSLKDLYPDFQAYLPTEVREAEWVKANFYVQRYDYGVVTDEDLIKKFIRREKAARTVTMGQPDALAGRPSYFDKFDSLLKMSLAAEREAWGTVPARPP